MIYIYATSNYLSYLSKQDRNYQKHIRLFKFHVLNINFMSLWSS